MLANLLTALLGITTILVCSLLVQAAWRRVFPGLAPDEDVLAGRLGCHGCKSPCQEQHCLRDRPSVPEPNQPEH